VESVAGNTTVKNEAAGSSEAFVPISNTIPHRMSEDTDLQEVVVAV
jgi:hypothetical protein